MDEIAIPQQEIVPLDFVAAGVVGLRTVFVNLFAIHGENTWVLVDAGLNGAAGRVVAWARQHFSGRPPRAVVLTHAHFDHVGALRSLLEIWDVPVYAHPDEVPYVTGARVYPPPDPAVGGGVMARMAGLYPREPIPLGGRARELPPNGTIPGLPGWRWIHTPGHTAGHVSLFRNFDRTLIAGDAVCTARQESFLAGAAAPPELQGPPAYFATDWRAARTSIERLAALQPSRIAPGHGAPMAGTGTLEALKALAARFDDVARPRQAAPSDGRSGGRASR